MPLFGTDGVRGVAGVDLTAELAHNLAIAAAHVLTDLGEFAGHRAKAIIGEDSRASGDYLRRAISSGLSKCGVDVIEVGILPTPAVSFLVTDMSADLGVMISASHNPATDNGIKFFARDGMKLPDHLEAKIEAQLQESWQPHVDPGSITQDNGAGDRYIEHLLATIDVDLKGLKVVVDCANGAASVVAPSALRRAGAEVIAIFDQPNGMNINQDCGSTHMANLIARVRSEGADLGIAHDGDADRVLAVDHEGSIVDGDQILGILAQHINLPTKSVVGTVMTNLGLITALRELGIDFIATPVGDRYVLERMLSAGHNLGGEQSGHIIMRDYAVTGDGLLTALHLMAQMVRSGKSLKELASFMRRYPQVLINVKGVARERLPGNLKIASAIQSAENELGDTGRVLLRASGTEPLIRVMVEAADTAQAQHHAENLAALVKSELAI